MAGTVPVSGDFTMQKLADTLTRHEQLADERITALTIDTTQARNLVTSVSEPQQLGAISIVAAGAPSHGTKVLSTTAYISGTKTQIDLYRLP